MNADLIYNLGYLHGRIASLNITEEDKQELTDLLSNMYREECRDDKPVRHIDVRA